MPIIVGHDIGGVPNPPAGAHSPPTKFVCSLHAQRTRDEKIEGLEVSTLDEPLDAAP
jgi:hypothetical protein